MVEPPKSPRFRQAHSRFVDKNAQVLGISCDHIYAHQSWVRAIGGLPYPQLGDWHPKGEVTAAYGLWNEEKGAGNRAVIVVDKDGVIRFRQTYGPGSLPNPEDILNVVEGLS